MSIACKSEGLWILANIACEPHICSLMINEMNVIDVINSLFSFYFVKNDPNTELN